ncbi:MAG: SDR family NAD(P)-dependent oxidoreductase [Candidatus Daviesbacteria bacterium]|nr:SDR family NAD(P)-dependent oxidoreductase [Candidatus Daviesbacteria bacterium]
MNSNLEYNNLLLKKIIENNMSKYLITGVSSGIGKALTKKLISDKQIVWGIARRGQRLKELKEELNNSANFIYTPMDQTEKNCWQSLVNKFKEKNFIPKIIIFNAAISQNDLKNGIEIETLKKMVDVNFLGIMRGINSLIPFAKPGTQFIAISSFSALKGSGIEGIGYAASKAALSIGFESLYQKYKDKGIIFKTIYFGPIGSGMGPFKKIAPFILSEDQAVNCIINSTKSNKAQFFYPKSIFFIFKIIKLLPSNIYFKILSQMESFHLKLKKPLC